MKQRAISILMRAVLAIGLGMLSQPQPVLGANAGDVLIVEVGADPASAVMGEPGGEFIEIYNNTTSTINLSSWTINDNGSTTITLPSINLGAGRILVIIADETLLGASGYNCTSSPLHHEPAAWFSGNLHNDNDRVILKDNSGTTIDAVSYGNDTTAFNPAANDVFNNSGRTLQRQTYNTNFTDSDTASDWTGSTGAGSPCDVGPTAITLSSFNAHGKQIAAQPEHGITAVLRWLSVILVGMGMVVMVVSYVVLRRRRPI